MIIIQFEKWQKLIFLHLAAVRAHPSAGDKFSVHALIEPLHLDRAVSMLAELVFDVHEDVYNIRPEKPLYERRLDINYR